MMSFILKHIIELLLSFFIALISVLYSKTKKYINNQKTIKHVLINLLKIEILELYEKMLNKTCINIYEFDKIESLLEQYKILEVNGSLEYVFKHINTLKVQEACMLDIQNIDKT